MIVGTPWVAYGKPEVCEQVRSRIDETAPTIGDTARLLVLAPYLSEATAPKLLTRAKTSSSARSAVELYLAIGLSRHASNLKRLRDEPRATRRELRLGQAIARFALGDGTLTGTIAKALYEGSVDERRATAHALSLMRQKRPQIMLYDALQDPDPEVRLAAGRVHYPRRSRRARRVLLELLESGAPEIREDVAGLLVEHHHRFSNGAPLPDRLRGRVLVDTAVRSRSGARTARVQLMSRDAVERRAAFATLAGLGTYSVKTLARLAAKPKARYGDVVEAELTMALALMGDTASIHALPKLEKVNAEAAAEVLFSFSGAKAPYSQLDFDHAASLARAIEPWVVRGVVSQITQRRIYDALDRAESNAAAALARSRLAGPSGAGLAAAIRVLSQAGTTRDVPILIAVADRKVSVRVEGYAAAAAICAASRQ